MYIGNEDPELFNWLFNARTQGGGFVSTIALAGLRADRENYQIVRPALLELKKKYPDYDRPASIPTVDRTGDAA